MKKTVLTHLAIGLCLLCAQFALADDPAAKITGRIHHVVLIWLDDEGNKKLESILNATAVLASIEEVQHLHYGRPVPSERAVVDGSYDIGITLSFDDQAALQRYLDDPVHLEYVKTQVKPYLEKLVIYDF